MIKCECNRGALDFTIEGNKGQLLAELATLENAILEELADEYDSIGSMAQFICRTIISFAEKDEND